MNGYLFVYGTLKDPKVQKKIIGRVIDSKPDILVGYKKSTVIIDGVIYPILIRHQNGIIKGEILNLSQLELEKVDLYETDTYRRIKVILKSGVEAWVYVK